MPDHGVTCDSHGWSKKFPWLKEKSHLQGATTNRQWFTCDERWVYIYRRSPKVAYLYVILISRLESLQEFSTHTHFIYQYMEGP